MRNTQGNAEGNTRENTGNSRLIASVASERQADIAQLNIIENKLNDLETVRDEVENFASEREELENERERLLLKLDCTENLETLSDSGLSSYSEQSNRTGLDSALVMQQFMTLSIKLGELDATLKAQIATNLVLQKKVESQENKITDLQTTNTNLTQELTQTNDELTRTKAVLENSLEARKEEVDRRDQQRSNELAEIRNNLSLHAAINTQHGEKLRHLDQSLRDNILEVEGLKQATTELSMVTQNTLSSVEKLENINANRPTLHRLWSPTLEDHLYTTSEDEVRRSVNRNAYKYEYEAAYKL